MILDPQIEAIMLLHFFYTYLIYIMYQILYHIVRSSGIPYFVNNSMNIGLIPIIDNDTWMCIVSSILFFLSFGILWLSNLSINYWDPIS
jgi:hypothetical protein